MNPWEFSPADITANIRLWHGLEDHAFPPHTAQQLVDELTTCESTFVADIGSLLILARWDDILADLVKKA